MFIRTVHLTFWAVAGLHLTAIAIQHEWLRFMTKPLLLPLLLLHFGLQWSRPLQRLHYLVLFAGLLCCAGDTLLLFEPQHPLYFMGGLASFLLAHLLYTACFVNLWRRKDGPIRIWAVALMLGYAGSLFWLLRPSLGDLTVPVAVYALSIAAMFISSVHAFTNQAAAAYCISGAVLFVLSDSLLAINKFYQPFAGANLWIMSTYIAAQWGIAKGLTIQFSRQ